MAEERPQPSRFPAYGPNGLTIRPISASADMAQQVPTDNLGLTGLLKSTSVTYHEQPLVLRRAGSPNGRGRSISPAIGRGRSVSPAPHPSVVNNSALATVHYEQSHTATLDMSVDGLSSSLIKKSIITPQPSSTQPPPKVIGERDTFSEVTGSVNSPLTRPWTSGGDGQRKVSISNNSLLTREEKKSVSRPASSGGQPRFAQAREKDIRDFQQHMYEKRRPKSGDPYLPMDERMIDALQREFANPADMFKQLALSPHHKKGAYLAEGTDRRPLLISLAARRSAARRMRQQERINLLNFDPAKISPKDRAALQLGRLVMTTVFDQPELTSSDNISRFFLDSWLAKNGGKAGKADALSIELMCGLQKAMNEHRYIYIINAPSNTTY